MKAVVSFKENCKNEEYSFVEEKSDEINEIFDYEGIKSYNFSYDKDTTLENFLSKKIDGLVEVDIRHDEFEKSQIEEEKKSKNEEISEKYIQSYKEILGIFKKAWGDKNLKFKNSPFKRFIKPKQLSLEGKILLNIN